VHAVRRTRAVRHLQRLIPSLRHCGADDHRRGRRDACSMQLAVSFASRPFSPTSSRDARTYEYSQLGPSESALAVPAFSRRARYSVRGGSGSDSALGWI
jgi:hypothetical protein